VNAKLDPAVQRWMTEGPTRAVMRALTTEGGGARFVGGAVRNALLGEPVGDIDIATPLKPEEVMQRLQMAGLGAVPTGIEHGTITAIAGGKPYEVTTLRRDVETFGRRAVVAYTVDWKEDAARRDFTINALYAGEDGSLFDYFGGLADLTTRRVRFIGDARARIREDYLRILRLFRFHAWYGRGDLDAEAVNAAIAEKSGLHLLSGERVQKELLRLLEAKAAWPALAVMMNTGILAEILPGNLQPTRLRHLIAIEGTNGLLPDSLLRLAAVLPDDVATARSLADGLKLSNAMRDRIVESAEKDSRIGAKLPALEAKKLIYRFGALRFRDQLLLQWADGNASSSDPAWRALFTLAQDWQRPSFTLDGNDVMALGIEEGPEIGIHLREVENWWIEQGFAPGRAELLIKLEEAVRRQPHA
jgi:poly(A) polymerase